MPTKLFSHHYVFKVIYLFCILFLFLKTDLWRVRVRGNPRAYKWHREEKATGGNQKTYHGVMARRAKPQLIYSPRRTPSMNPWSHGGTRRGWSGGHIRVAPRDLIPSQGIKCGAKVAFHVSSMGNSHSRFPPKFFPVEVLYRPSPHG